MSWRKWFGGRAHTTDDLIAEAEAARASDSAAAASATPKTAASVPPAAPQDEIARLVREGKKIEAVKLYRETYVTGLKEAADAVAAVATGHPMPTPREKRPGYTEAQMLSLIDEGQLIHAIKAYRELYGTGLREAKDAVDAIAAGRAAGGAGR